MDKTKKELNILALVNVGTAVQMMKTIKANKYIFITTKKVSPLQCPKGYVIGKNVFCYSHRSLKRGRYFPKMDWQKVQPVDGSIVEKMLPYESTTLKMVERIPPVKVNYDTRKNYYMNNLRYWTHVIKAHNINVFYRCAPPHEGYDMVIYGLCRVLGIPIWLFGPFHPGMAYLSRTIENPFPNFTGKVIANNLKFVDYLNGELQQGPKLIPQLKELIDNHWNKKRPAKIPVVVPAKKRKTQKTLLARHKGILLWYRNHCVKPQLEKKYIYVPLHFQFEATTCPMGGVFNDQLLMIELLARIGITIYVKEHPRMSKNRSLPFYKRIHNLKYVNLISQKTDNYTMIDNCLCVANVTGSAGWEAILRGKQTLLFGNIFHQYAPGCYQVKDLNDIKEAIEKIKTFKSEKRLLEVFLFTLQEYLFLHNIRDITAAFKSELEKNAKIIENEEFEKNIYSPMKSSYDKSTGIFTDENLEKIDEVEENEND